MPSPAERASARPRAAFEGLCRLAAVLALAAALWRTSAEHANAADYAPETLQLSVGQTDSSLAAHLIQRIGAPNGASVDTIPLRLSVLPSPSQRAMLGVLSQSGTVLPWRDGSGSRGFAAQVVREAGPTEPLHVRAAVPRGAVSLRDAGGLMDSLVAGRDSLVAWQLRSAAAPLRLETARAALSLPMPAPTAPKMLRVMGEPGWEFKFTVAALEEAGWRVDGAVRVSPTARVTLGPVALLDTAKHAAVVITDSTEVDAASLQRFVQRGGGLVLLGDALRIPALAALRPAQATLRHGALAGGLETDQPLTGLERWELTPRAGAQVLQAASGDADEGHAHEEALLVAHRVGAGRVVASAHRELWRWRMEGPDGGLEAHRRWWQDVVAAAGAPAPAATFTASERTPFAGDAAPYADLVGWIGAPIVTDSAPSPPSGQTAAQVTRSTPSRTPWAAWLGVLAMALLCAEWGSRRLRGLR
jgi:hypothetical protein